MMGRRASSDQPAQDESDREATVESPAQSAATELRADVLLLNTPVSPGLAEKLREAIEARPTRRDQVIVILTSSGGIADDAYRAAMAIRAYYPKVIVCVAGWCKSAATLLAISANELIIGCNGEMGPLDVQIAVKDELVDNRDSGLILDAAIRGLTENAFGVFEKFMTSLISHSRGAITFRTAAHLAADVTIGLMAPIYEKIDPLRMGADQRAQKIASDYAVRLNLIGKNLKGVDALSMLLNGYPSHGFVIDLEEAQRLFTNVKALEGYLKITVEGLGALAREPRNDSVICYLDGDEDGKDAEAPGASVEPQATSPGDAVGKPATSAE